jgi:membrane protein
MAFNKELIKKTGAVLKKSIIKYREDNPIKLAATLSFITLFAIPPILIMVITAIGLIIGEDFATGKIYKDLTELVGYKSAALIENVIKNYRDAGASTGRMVFTVFVFIIASTTFFAIIQNSLNYIWRVRPKPKYNFLKNLRDRALSFVIIFSLGLLFFASLFMDIAMAVLKDYLNAVLPDFTYIVLKTVRLLFSFTAFTITFAVFFKFLPDVRIKWRVTWMGAIITAILFTLGKYLIGFGLSHVYIESMYGTAGSVVVFLLWVFYSSLIFYYGAEITEQYAETFSKNIVPKKNAVEFEIKEIEH